MSNHTPEPWPKPEYFDDEMFSESWQVDNVGAFDNEHDADRAVACVNACAGINPEAVSVMLEALRSVRNMHNMLGEEFSAPLQFWQVMNSVITTLEKVEGKA